MNHGDRCTKQPILCSANYFAAAAQAAVSSVEICQTALRHDASKYIVNNNQSIQTAIK